LVGNPEKKETEVGVTNEKKKKGQKGDKNKKGPGGRHKKNQGETKCMRKCVGMVARFPGKRKRGKKLLPE